MTSSLRFTRFCPLALVAMAMQIPAQTPGQPLPVTGTTESRIGPLAFEGGYPTDATVLRLYDEMDFQRAVQAYIWAVPLVGFAQWQKEHQQVFGAEDGDVVLYVSYRDKLGLLTANTTTPYLLGFPNLERTGPLVIDVPAGKTAGAILDFWQRPVTDLGLTGPDRGAGGKYLILGPGQEVDDTSGYIVVRAPMNNIMHGIRVLVPAPEEAKKLREAYQAYPYSKRDAPPRTRIVTPGGKDWQGWQPRGLEYWRLVSKMLSEEPVHERDRIMVAMLKPLGIEKGKPFQPDARQTKILEEAAVVGEAMAMSLSYAKRQKEAVMYPGRQWKNAVLLEADQETEHHTSLDERTAWFYEAVTLSAGMTTKTPGEGQVYLGVQKDKDGVWLQGGNSYTLRVPPNPPVAQFWGMTLYDTGTRCFIDNEHEIAGLDSRADLIKNADGSVDLYFGPTAPAGKERNWIPTVPGRGWFGLFRFYAPTEAYFDRSWALPDVHRVENAGGQVQDEAPAVVVTRETYCRAETDRAFYNATKLAGGVNRFFHFRTVTPLDNQTVVRMNRDTLYSAAVVDTSKGATITVPRTSDGRYISVLLIDNDHYCPGVIYETGTHELPRDTKYLGVLVRIHLRRPTDPEDVALVNRLQDQLVIKARSADPFPEPKWDAASLDRLTAAYKAEFAKYQKYPDGFMGARGVADESIRHIACAGAWGLSPTEHAAKFNYNPGLPAKGHYTATYKVPENNAFWSITVYGADGYMKSENAILNEANTVMNPDGTFTVHFGSKEDCGDVPNRLDVSEGWNFLMRVYRPGKSVRDGSYKLPEVTLASR